MRTGGENPTAEHAALALYLLGALDEADRVTFEEHLAGCWECLSAAGELGSVTSALGGLGDADWEAFATVPPEFTRPPAPAQTRQPDATVEPALTGADETKPGAERTRPGTDDGQHPEPGDATLDGAASRPGTREGTGPRTAGSTRPVRSRPPTAASGAGPRPSAARSRPSGSARRRRYMLWGGLAAAAVAVVLAGGVVTGFGDRDELVLTATGEAPAQGVSLSVSITTDEERSSTMRITATGLRQGLRYRLFAVTRDGTTHVVRDWTASTGPQQVTGELSIPIDELAFVTVGLADGTAIVTAPFSR